MASATRRMLIGRVCRWSVVALPAIAAGCGADAAPVARLSVSSAPAVDQPPGGAPSTATAPTTSTPDVVPDEVPAAEPAEAACTGRPLPTPPSTGPTPAELAGPWMLRGDGLGPFDFGTPVAAVVDALEARLGPKEYGMDGTFPRVADEGGCLDDLAVTRFDHPYTTSWCAAPAVCAHFGGPSPDELVLVGWWLYGPHLEDTGLATAEGITVGSRWGDHVDAVALGSGCRWDATARIGDIEAVLIARSGSFGTPEEPSTSLPDPADVVVDQLWAGAQQEDASPPTC